MSLQVIEMANDSQNGKAVVIIESDKDGKSAANAFSLAITELQQAEARNMATSYATQTGGVANARTEFPGSPYPVDDKGEVITDPHNQTIHRYRVDIPVTSGMR